MRRWLEAKKTVLDAAQKMAGKGLACVKALAVVFYFQGQAFGVGD